MSVLKYHEPTRAEEILGDWLHMPAAAVEHQTKVGLALLHNTPYLRQVLATYLYELQIAEANLSCPDPERVAALQKYATEKARFSAEGLLLIRILNDAQHAAAQELKS